MPPSPGHIHQLPVKVLYSLDGSDQSYLTVLSELQDVYVHPGQPGYGTDEEAGPIGSTLLKALAQGVCYASPECVPSPSSLDFSVYNLDPTPRTTNQSTPTRPFGTPSDHSHSHSQSSAWSGKGFLSWAMNEDSSGTTLVKGRIMKEHDFDSSRFQSDSSGLGGLEALMRAGGGGDSRGWGLEVVISLKMVNPAGKGEFSGRKEFEKMLFEGPGAATGSVLVSGPGARGSSPARNFRPPAPAPASSSRTGTGPTTTNANSAQAQTQRGARPPPPVNRSSGSSLPPSSIPMAPSSSQAGPSRPPSSTGPGSGRPPQTQNQAGSSSTGTGIGMHASNSTPRPPPVPTAQAQLVRPPAQPSNAGTKSTTTSAPTVTPPKPQAASAPHSVTSRNRDRQVTPPPLPRPRSPPPTTPHRRALRDLLQADGKMSPSLAKDLVNNPSLLALLKSIPTTKSDPTSTSTGTAKGKGKAKDDSAKTNGNGPSSSRSTRDRDGTPTPTAPKTAVKGESIPGGCFNCGTMHTTMWRVKSYPDGTKKKVCDACGLYFNKHKSMRPKELWDSEAGPSSSAPVSGSGSGVKRPNPHPTPPPGIRQSPRLSRQTGPGSDSHPPIPSVQDSPSKRRRTSGRPPIQPSPRMATRSTARSDIGVGVGGGRMEPFPFSSPSGSRSNSHSQSNGLGFGTSPAVPLDPSHAQSGGNMNNSDTNTDADTGGIEDMDLDALLAQLTNGGGSGDNGMNLNLNLGHGQGQEGGMSLEELFATVDNAAASDDALAEDMMRFLAGLEGDSGTGPGDGTGPDTGEGQKQESGEQGS